MHGEVLTRQVIVLDMFSVVYLVTIFSLEMLRNVHFVFHLANFTTLLQNICIAFGVKILHIEILFFRLSNNFQPLYYFHCKVIKDLNIVNNTPLNTKG